MSLKQEQIELLKDMTSEQWEAVCAVAHILVGRHAQAVLSYDLSKGDRELVCARARLDGASAILNGMEHARAELRKGK